MSYPDRVAAAAADIKPSRVILSLLALPFYVLGFVLGLVFAVVLWGWAAVGVGMTDARRRGGSHDAR